MRLKSCDIRGKVLVFGDLHLSSSFSGQHKNYQYECYYNMERIMDLVAKEKADAENKYLGFVSKSKIFNSYREVLVHFSED